MAEVSSSGDQENGDPVNSMVDSRELVWGGRWYWLRCHSNLSYKYPEAYHVGSVHCQTDHAMNMFVSH